MSDETSESELEEGGTQKDTTLPSLVPPDSKKFSIWKWWGIHDSKFVSIGTILAAIATAFMAYFTYSSIDEARRMREETKRLVDLSIQDFKIRSYPSFLVAKPLLIWKDDNFFETITIHNKGEITAHNVTLLLVRSFVDSTNKILFVPELGTFYKDDEAKSTLNFETKIFREGFKTLESRSKIEKTDSKGRLAHKLLYIRFKIPFENKYHYEVFAYYLKRDASKKDSDEDAYFWQETDSEFKEKLIYGHFNTLKNSKNEIADRIKTFLSDYPEFTSER